MNQHSRFLAPTGSLGSNIRPATQDQENTSLLEEGSTIYTVNGEFRQHLNHLSTPTLDGRELPDWKEKSYPVSHSSVSLLLVPSSS